MKYILLLVSLPLAAALSKEENEKVKKIYNRIRRDAVVYEELSRVESPSVDNCTSSNNISYERLSLARKYTSPRKRTEYKAPDKDDSK